jgi:Ca-activated chloride channel homolog
MKNDCPSLTTAQGDSVVLRSVEAHGRLDGLLLSMTLRQVFRNDQAQNLEVTYTFPLAWGAVLLGLEATLGGKRMAGQVFARREARERYEDAVENGDAPIMVEKAHGGVFSASLGSLKPGEEAVIELTYAQLLSYEQGRIRLVVPTTIAPRYGDAVRQGKLQPDQAVEADLLAEHGFGLSVTLTGPVAQARIGSPSHAVTQQRHTDAASHAVTVSLQGQAWLDRDFVLLLDGLEGRSFAIAGPDSRSGEGHLAVIASYCPTLPATPQAPLRLKILVDCSGSMAGQSIAQARDALRPLATQLTPQDQVAFSRFGNRPKRVLGAVGATPRNVQALVDAIDETHADLGGTEMADALADTFSLRMGAARHAEEADVLLVTDGEVWDAQAIVDAARRSGHRVYALGVGSAPAESLLREMAEATGGACEFATPQEDMAEAIQRLLARIQLALPVEAHLEVLGRPLWTSPLPCRLAAGETVHLCLRLLARPEQAPSLQLAGQAATPAELSIRDDDLIARLVAAREIGMTADKTQARELAERYQLVTEDTNLLLVIERAAADKTNGMPALHSVRPMLAAGWGGTGQVTHERTIAYSRREAPPLQELRIDAEASFSVPSVWRTNRSTAAAKVDVLSSGGLDDFEIPAFLRMQTDQTLTPAPQRPTPAGSTVQPARPREMPAIATPEQIIAAFNKAAALGQAFRPTLRAVWDLALETSLCQAIVDACRHVGSPLRAWACYLLWLHEGSDPGLRLTPVALALTLDQVNSISSDARAAAMRPFQTPSESSDAALVRVNS